MLRMIDRHAVQQMLTAGVRIGEVARYFEVSRRTIERIRKEPVVEGAEGAVARWKRGVGRPPVPATVRERMRALIAEDPEEAHRLGESTFYRLHRAEREGLSKELMVRFEGVAGDSSGSGTSDSRNGASAATPSASTPSVGWSTRSATARWFDAEYVGKWELPVFGGVTAPTAVLIRPDGYVAWVGDGTDLGLPNALTTWFGPPTAA